MALREQETLGLITQGESNATIAKRLTLCLKTVQNHVSNIFSKLQVVDLSQGIARTRTPRMLWGNPAWFPFSSA